MSRVWLVELAAKRSCTMPADAGSACRDRGSSICNLSIRRNTRCLSVSVLAHPIAAPRGRPTEHAYRPPTTSRSKGRQPFATTCYAAHINRHPALPNSHQDHFSSCLLLGRTSDIRVTLRLSIGVQRLSYVCRIGASSTGVGTAGVAYPKSAPGTRSVTSREQPPRSTLSPSKGFQRRRTT